MSSGWRGVAAGALGLVAFQTVVGSQQGPGRVGGIFTSIAGAVRRFADPTVPAFGPTKQATTDKPGGGDFAVAPVAPPAPYPSRNQLPDTVKST